MRTDRFIELVEAFGQSPSTKPLQMSATMLEKRINSSDYHSPVIRIVQCPRRYRLQKCGSLLLSLDRIAQDGGDNRLADVGVGPVHLMGTQRAPKSSAHGSHRSFNRDGASVEEEEDHRVSPNPQRPPSD